jgi:hypothetical protein
VAHFERIEAGALRRESKPGEPRQRPASQPFDEEGFDEEALEDDIDEEAALEIFDPTCLLTVVETLSVLTHGLAFDPAAGEVI